MVFKLNQESNMNPLYPKEDDDPIEDELRRQAYEEYLENKRDMEKDDLNDLLPYEPRDRESFINKHEQ